MKLEVNLFGPLRPYGSTLVLDVAEGAAAAQVRAAIEAAIVPAGGEAARALLSRSALATETDVLADDAPLPAGTRSVAVLPPVCGG